MQYQLVDPSVIDLCGHVCADGLAPPVRRRTGIEQTQAVGSGGIPGNMAVPEDKDVGVREEPFTPLLATFGRAGVMDDRKPQAVAFDTRHLREALPYLWDVVVAVDRNEPSGVSIERVQRGEVYPITRVNDDIRAVYLGP